MNVGDKFNTKGYEYVASIDMLGGSGRVVVLHNHSSHYLIALVEAATTQLAIDDGAGPERGEEGKLLGSIRYFDLPTEYYPVIIDWAVAEALRRR